MSFKAFSAQTFQRTPHRKNVFCALQSRERMKAKTTETQDEPIQLSDSSPFTKTRPIQSVLQNNQVRKRQEQAHLEQTSTQHTHEGQTEENEEEALVITIPCNSRSDSSRGTHEAARPSSSECAWSVDWRRSLAKPLVYTKSLANPPMRETEGPKLSEQENKTMKRQKCVSFAKQQPSRSIHDFRPRKATITKFTTQWRCSPSITKYSRFHLVDHSSRSTHKVLLLSVVIVCQTMTKYSTHALQKKVSNHHEVPTCCCCCCHKKNIHHEVLTIYFALEVFRRWLLLVTNCPSQYKARNDREPLRQERAEVGLLWGEVANRGCQKREWSDRCRLRSRRRHAQRWDQENKYTISDPWDRFTSWKDRRKTAEHRIHCPTNKQSDNFPLKQEKSMLPAKSVYQHNLPKPFCKKETEKQIRLRRNRYNLVQHTLVQGKPMRNWSSWTQSSMSTQQTRWSSAKTTDRRPQRSARCQNSK